VKGSNNFLILYLVRSSFIRGTSLSSVGAIIAMDSTQADRPAFFENFYEEMAHREKLLIFLVSRPTGDPFRSIEARKLDFSRRNLTSRSPEKQQ
jgi:hypothetical protein